MLETTSAAAEIRRCRPAVRHRSLLQKQGLKFLFVLVLLHMLVVIGYERGEVEAERIIIEKIHSFKSIFT